ncbi:hypothetical protein GCM10020254_24440 [Streptomyces goshikiensis]
MPQLTAAAEMPSRARNWRREVGVEVNAAGMTVPCQYVRGYGSERGGGQGGGGPGAQGFGELVDGLEQVQLGLGPQPVGAVPALDGGVEDEPAGGDVPGAERGEDRAQGVVDGQDMGEAAAGGDRQNRFSRPARPAGAGRGRP